MAAASLAAEETAARWKATDPPNRPIGEAKGIFPGRVVWTHNPDAAQWDGNTESRRMVRGPVHRSRAGRGDAERDACSSLTGAKTDAEAWDALFRHYNRTHGRGDVGYKPGEKLAIKVNMNCSKRRPDFKEGSYNTPQLTMALLRQLVKTAGVPETDIVVYDASRWVGDAIFLPAHAEFPGIRFGDREGSEGRFEVQPDKNVALHFADPSVADSGKTYLPACVTGATYLINAAVLKGHSLAAVTLPAKNHFGSVYRDSEQARKTHNGWNPGNMHDAIMVRTRPMGTYNPLVELMGHKDLGGKTILYLIDGLYAAPHQGKLPERVGVIALQRALDGQRVRLAGPGGDRVGGGGPVRGREDASPDGRHRGQLPSRGGVGQRAALPRPLRPRGRRHAAREPRRSRALEQRREEAVLAGPGHGQGYRVDPCGREMSGMPVTFVESR